MKSSNIRVIALAFLALLLSSCKINPPTTIDYDTKYNYSKLKTFAWIKAPKNDDKNKEIKSLNDRRQTAAINSDLISKGFKLLNEAENADFLLKTHTITDKKTDIDVFYNDWGYHSYYFGHSFGWLGRGSSTIAREYKIGTLVLDIIDPIKKEVLWRGALSRKLGVYLNRTPEERDIIAKTNAKSLLKDFPPSS